MKYYMKKILFLIICTAIALSPAITLADFEDLGAGSRAIGLGNSFTALADDPFGLYYNPGGLGFIRTGQAGADLGKLYMGLDDGSQLVSGFASVLVPITKTRLKNAETTDGSVITSSDTAPVRVSYIDHIGTVGVGWKYFSLLDNYQESTYYLGFGRRGGDSGTWDQMKPWLFAAGGAAAIVLVLTLTSRAGVTVVQPAKAA
jgi:hypothetical protein